MPSSSSSFYLDLDLEASTVHLVRPLNSGSTDGGMSPTSSIEPSISSSQDNNNKEVPVLQSSFQQEIAPKWGKFTCLVITRMVTICVFKIKQPLE